MLYQLVLLSHSKLMKKYILIDGFLIRFNDNSEVFL